MASRLKRREGGSARAKVSHAPEKQFRAPPSREVGAVVAALTSCQFEATDVQADEAVNARLVAALAALVSTCASDDARVRAVRARSELRGQLK